MKRALLALAIALIIGASAVLAETSVPTSVDVVSSSYRSAFGSGSTTVSAYAGNMSQIIISSYTMANKWQGYYGNITGSVTLDNAANWSMFSWNEITSPTGEVYMANQTVTDWSTIRCINLSSTYPGHNCTGQNESCLNITEIEGFYSMDPTDSDGVDETFNNTLSGGIEVGITSLYNCPLVNLFTNGTQTESQFWNETLLTVNNSETVIYAGIINEDTPGFNNQTWDFQMLVAENGEDNEITTYYVYTEIA